MKPAIVTKAVPNKTAFWSCPKWKYEEFFGVVTSWFGNLFKYQFHNWITGKLWDFAGLIVFVLFWQVLFPKRKAVIYLITAILFVIWKSSLSDGFIELWNNHMFYAINRVIDYSDLLALLVLPFVYGLSFENSPKIKLN